MPWGIGDIEGHIKGLTDKQKEVWVKVANGALSRCIEAGGSDEECAPRAIRQANAVAKKVQEAQMPELEEAATIKARARGLLRDADAILADKMLPEDLRTAFQAMRAALKRKWADLEAEADGEKEEEKEAIQEATKTEDGKPFPAGDYAYVPDPASPSTWKLRLTATPGGGPDSGIVGAACAALGAGFRGQKVQIPAGDLAGVKAKVRAAWKKANPDKEDAEMPPAIREAEDMEVIGDFIALVEKVRKDGTVPLKLIAPGWGSSGYYSPEILERDAAVFGVDTKMYWDHPTVSQDAERPERSLRDLAAVLTSPARYDGKGPAGPGLYADAKVFGDYQKAIEDMGAHIGVSILATGQAKQGEADGKQGPIIDKIVAARSVDFVTTPGAGGQILSLFEAARGERRITEEVKSVTEDEAKALRETNASLEAELGRLREAALLNEARGIVAEALAKIDMPALTRERLTESLGKNPPVKDGALDKEGYASTIQGTAKAELEYLAKATGSGQIRGMGVAGLDNGGGLKESYLNLYLHQGMAQEQAEKLAALAAGS